MIQIYTNLIPWPPWQKILVALMYELPPLMAIQSSPDYKGKVD